MGQALQCVFPSTDSPVEVVSGIWGDAGEQLPWPISWNGSFKMRVKISHLWQIGSRDKSFGFDVICEDLCPQVQITASPWAK